MLSVNDLEGRSTKHQMDINHESISILQHQKKSKDQPPKTASFFHDDIFTFIYHTTSPHIRFPRQPRRRIRISKLKIVIKIRWRQ